ncbi:MAG: hypothetical protein R6U96_01795 [Promethearchaeia archaeon]
MRNTQKHPEVLPVHLPKICSHFHLKLPGWPFRQLVGQLCKNRIFLFSRFKRATIGSAVHGVIHQRPVMKVIKKPTFYPQMVGHHFVVDQYLPGRFPVNHWRSDQRRTYDIAMDSPTGRINGMIKIVVIASHNLPVNSMAFPALVSGV